jgi:hypothetical protein
MKVPVIPTLKRFIESTAGAAEGQSGSERTRRRGKDFMTQDLTGSARRYPR